MKRVLIVDDEHSVRAVLHDFLKRKQYTVVEAESGPEALAQLEAFRPDIVLLDIRMPGMDGLEVLRRIKQRSPDMIVIMLTATDEPDIGRKAMETGANDYITKPFSFEQLETNLSTHLLFQSDG